MKNLNNKGFMASAVLYVMLGLFITLMIGVIAIYSNRKITMDKMKKEIITELEEDNKLGHLVGDRKDYFAAAASYLATGKSDGISNCTKQSNTVKISINKLIKNGLLPNDIVSPLTNRKEIVQKNYIIAVKQGANYSYSYVDEATSKVIC